MLQIPKNVMQIGEINPHTKIYMEDYVHTFLEHEKGAETYLVFGKKEERDDVFYYMIYGVEKKTDWDRGCFPYFKKQERIGTVEGPRGSRMFKPLRGSGMLLDGYFIFYEQNEDMQSYMIASREAAAASGCEEKEEVLEAVRTRQERQRQEEEQTMLKPVYRRDADGTHRRKTEAVQKTRSQKHTPWTFFDLCRAGSLVLVLLLVVLGLTSLNRYPDMKAMTGMFSAAAKAVMGEKKTDQQNPLQEAGLIVEEETAPAPETADPIAEQGAQELEDLSIQKEATPTEVTEENVAVPEKEVAEDATEPEEEVTENAAEPEEDAVQVLARPSSYIVKKGDSLAEIARKFYGDTSIIKEICKVNEIRDPDQIHAGQNILLP